MRSARVAWLCVLEAFLPDHCSKECSIKYYNNKSSQGKNKSVMGKKAIKTTLPSTKIPKPIPFQPPLTPNNFNTIPKQWGSPFCLECFFSV